MKSTLPLKTLIYTCAASLAFAWLYANAMHPNFLNGPSERIAFDIGFLTGGLILPWLLSLPFLLICILYKIVRKKEKNILANWIYIAAAIASILLLLIVTTPLPVR